MTAIVPKSSYSFITTVTTPSKPYKSLNHTIYRYKYSVFHLKHNPDLHQCL
jgi:hypothetical protein